MPENETLFPDARTANRWRPIGDRMDGGQTSIQAFPEIQKQFYKGLQRVWRQWTEKGVNPGLLFDAALNDLDRLVELVKQTGFHSYAQLLRDVAAGLQDATPEILLRAFLNAAWEVPCRELRINCREDAQSPDFKRQVDTMLDRMCRLLVNKPSRFPPLPPRKAPRQDLETQLAVNLL
jgi:hypothetical protein